MLEAAVDLVLHLLCPRTVCHGDHLGELRLHGVCCAARAEKVCEAGCHCLLTSRPNILVRIQFDSNSARVRALTDVLKYTPFHSQYAPAATGEEDRGNEPPTA